MYRVVFKSVDPRTQLLTKEFGPWLPNREDAERWANFFNERGHHAHATIENATDRNLASHVQA
ncbi:MAG TPA: hypothetical protein VF472_05440 [Burkholderiaceae bacterium]